MPVEHRHDKVVSAAHRREDGDRQKEKILRPGTHAASRALVRPGREGRDHGGAVLVTLEGGDFAVRKLERVYKVVVDDIAGLYDAEGVMPEDDHHTVVGGELLRLERRGPRRCTERFEVA